MPLQRVSTGRFGNSIWFDPYLKQNNSIVSQLQGDHYLYILNQYTDEEAMDPYKRCHEVERRVNRSYGATTSGLMRPSLVGPILENGATVEGLLTFSL